MVTNALKAFLEHAKGLSPYHQAGLVFLVFLTPRSGPIRDLFSQTLSHFGLFDRILRKVLFPALVFECTLIVYALAAGPLQGMLANILVALITTTSVGLLFILTATLEAKAFIITTYRQRTIYEKIKSASRNSSLYIGRLQHSARALTGLPGNVNRPLDGIMILGCLSDLAELADLSTGSFSSKDIAPGYRDFYQFDQMESTSTILGMAYGAISETLWAQNRKLSALLGLVFQDRYPRTIRSDSGSLFYELFLHGQSLQSRLLPALLMLMIFDLQYALILLGAMAAIMAFQFSNEYLKHHQVRSDSDAWSHLKEHLNPFTRAIAVDRKTRLSAQEKNLVKELNNDFRHNRSISLRKLKQVLDLVVRLATTDQNQGFIHELLFFTYWEHETGTETNSRHLSRNLFTTPPLDTVLDMSQEFSSGAQSNLLSEIRDSSDDSGAIKHTAITDESSHEDTQPSDNINEEEAEAPLKTKESESVNEKDRSQAEPGDLDRVFLDDVSRQDARDEQSARDGEQEAESSTSEDQIDGSTAPPASVEPEETPEESDQGSSSNSEKGPEEAERSEDVMDAPPEIPEDFDEDEFTDLPEDEPDLDDLPDPVEEDHSADNMDEMLDSFMSENGLDEDGKS